MSFSYVIELVLFREVQCVRKTNIYVKIHVMYVKIHLRDYFSTNVLV